MGNLLRELIFVLNVPYITIYVCTIKISNKTVENLLQHIEGFVSMYPSCPEDS